MNPPPTSTEFTDLLAINKIIPEILSIESIQSLKGPLSIHYPTNDLTVGLGEKVERSKVQEIPTIIYPQADPSSTYTLIMTDPDLFMHDDQLAGQVRHWYQSGLSFDSKTKKSIGIKNGAASTDYVGPTPGAGTGHHRYIFILALEPPNYIATPDPKQVPQGNSDLKGRMQFDAGKFLEEEKLKIEAIGLMLVAADLKSTVDNVGLAVESLGNKIMGK